MNPPKMADEIIQEQFQSFKEAFSIFDDDAIGKKLAAVIWSFNCRPSEEELWEMMGEINANRDGILEFMEFFNRMTTQVKEAEETEEELKEAFKVFDKDQDGFISPNELSQVMINLGEKLTDEEVEQMIKEADLDGDGLVNYDDFFHLMTTLV